MKRILLLVCVIIAITAIYAAWNVFGPTVSAPAAKYFYIKTGSSYADVKNELLDQKIISGGFFFDRIAKQVKYDKQVKPGRYEIKKGSLVNLVRMLKAGNQAAVRLVITKLRTKENLAGKIGQNFEVDSARFMNFICNNDSISKYGLDSNTVMTLIIPNSYLFYWNSSIANILDRFSKQKQNFWDGTRTQKATALHLTPNQVYTIASIVEEETNQQEDKGKIASTYINRLAKGMKLEADPTVKYAMRDFGLKRILYGHLQYQSPYNTYQNTGLPPGPICTPSINTIDAVLDAPQTNYLFFVAKPDLRGYSNFAETYPQHLAFAKAYQQALDSLMIVKSQHH
ncbi:MAG: endolytic transglycosylase MltG [Ferruginibacter sp.]